MESTGIELLPKTPPSGRSRIIEFWGKTIGIPLIIVLQLLSLGMFAFRAKLETDLRNLYPSIEDKEEVVAQSLEFEEVFLDTQQRLNLIAKSKLELCYSCAIKKLEALAPSEVTLTQIKISGTAVEISAKTPKGISFAAFIANILEEDAIKEALLTSGNLNQDGEFLFALNLTLDKTKLQK